MSPKWFSKFHSTCSIAQVCPFIRNAYPTGKGMPFNCLHYHIGEMMHIDNHIRDTACHHFIQGIIQ